MDLIITSRMGSSRLPGKALKEVVGFGSMLEILIKRAKLSNQIDRVIIATTKLESDDALVDWAKEKNYNFFRGSENDVLQRLIDTCEHYNVKNFIEILGDNPFVDPDVINKCVRTFKSKSLNYVATMTKEYKYADLNFCFPIGIRIQIISTQILKLIKDNITSDYEREHATSYLYDKPNLEGVELIKNDIYEDKLGFSNWNYAVNDIDGFNNMAFILATLGIDFSWIEMIKLSNKVKMFN
jgi:spore coat polysaccharide biosynthesis protein SpsF